MPIGLHRSLPREESSTYLRNEERKVSDRGGDRRAVGRSPPRIRDTGLSPLQLARQLRTPSFPGGFPRRTSRRKATYLEGQLGVRDGELALCGAGGRVNAAQHKVLGRRGGRGAHREPAAFAGRHRLRLGGQPAERDGGEENGEAQNTHVGRR